VIGIAFGIESPAEITFFMLNMIPFCLIQLTTVRATELLLMLGQRLRQIGKLKCHGCNAYHARRLEWVQFLIKKELEMDAIVEILTSRLPRLLYPFTVEHLISFLVASLVAFYVIEHLLRIKWFRRLYIAILILSISSIWQQGDKKEAAKEAAKDIFKLAIL
jgi:hypothetical protein